MIIHVIYTWLGATNGNTVIANMLISNGADVNRRDKEGQTPLMVGTND